MNRVCGICTDSSESGNFHSVYCRCWTMHLLANTYYVHTHCVDPYSSTLWFPQFYWQTHILLFLLQSHSSPPIPQPSLLAHAHRLTNQACAIPTTCFSRSAGIQKDGGEGVGGRMGAPQNNVKVFFPPHYLQCRSSSSVTVMSLLTLALWVFPMQC